MLVHVPKKWQHLSPFKPGSKIDEPIAFVDLTPTLLSLTGLEKPTQMQGRAFLGSKRVEPSEDDIVFLYADRFDEIYGMRRGITDGRWKYIRRFTPHLSAAPYSYYQFGQDGWKDWQQAWKKGKLTGRHKTTWEGHQPVEELFDTHADPWEVKNLASDPTHAERLKRMRSRLREKMIEVNDSAIVPEPMFAELAQNAPITQYITSRKDDLPALIDLAFKATDRDTKYLPLFVSQLNSQDPIRRYWATQGCLILGKSAAPAQDALIKTLKDKHSTIRVAAAHTLIEIGKKEVGKTAILAELTRNNGEYAELNIINTLTQLDLLASISNAWIDTTLKNKKAGRYVIRLAQRIRDQRKSHQKK